MLLFSGFAAVICLLYFVCFGFLLFDVSYFLALFCFALSSLAPLSCFVVLLVFFDLSFHGLMLLMFFDLFSGLYWFLSAPLFYDCVCFVM